MNSYVLGQCAECHYTETLHVKGRRIETSLTFARKGNEIVHVGCRGAVRLWTGKPYAFRASL